MNKLLIVCIYLIVLISVPLFETVVKNKIRRIKNKPFYISNGNIKIDYQKNKGAVLGILSKNRKAILVLTTIMLILIVVISLIVLLFVEKRYILKIGLMALSTGALSNSLERYIYKHVVDYFSFPKSLIKPLRYVVFNMADIFIFIGSFILLISLIIGNRYI